MNKKTSILVIGLEISKKGWEKNLLKRRTGL